jgi:RNA polymerase sigma factor (sigma-70 family)
MNGFRSRTRRAAVALRRVTRSLPPDDAIARVEERELIVRALGTLTPRQRAAVVLIDILDYAAKDAAELLGITPSTIRVLLSRGRAQLRTAMGAQHD